MKAEQTKTIIFTGEEIDEVFYEGVEKRLSYSSEPVRSGEIVRERSPLTFEIVGDKIVSATIEVNSLPETEPTP